MHGSDAARYRTAQGAKRTVSLSVLEDGVGLQRKKVLYNIALPKPNGDAERSVSVLVHLRSQVESGGREAQQSSAGGGIRR